MLIAFRCADRHHESAPSTGRESGYRKRHRLFGQPTITAPGARRARFGPRVWSMGSGFSGPALSRRRP
eukprot:1626655-Alexandrium_andersonii.AAC.1